MEIFSISMEKKQNKTVEQSYITRQAWEILIQDCMVLLVHCPIPMSGSIVSTSRETLEEQPTGSLSYFLPLCQYM